MPTSETPIGSPVIAMELRITLGESALSVTRLPAASVA